MRIQKSFLCILKEVLKRIVSGLLVFNFFILQKFEMINYFLNVYFVRLNLFQQRYAFVKLYRIINFDCSQICQNFNDLR